MSRCSQRSPARLQACRRHGYVTTIYAYAGPVRGETRCEPFSESAWDSQDRSRTRTTAGILGHLQPLLVACHRCATTGGAGRHPRHLGHSDNYGRVGRKSAEYADRPQASASSSGLASDPDGSGSRPARVALAAADGLGKVRTNHCDSSKVHRASGSSSSSTRLSDTNRRK